jgi:hypothetical protein
LLNEELWYEPSHQETIADGDVAQNQPKNNVCVDFVCPTDGVNDAGDDLRQGSGTWWERHDCTTNKAMFFVAVFVLMGV